jgi:hypothetical protein
MHAQLSSSVYFLHATGCGPRRLLRHNRAGHLRSKPCMPAACLLILLRCRVVLRYFHGFCRLCRRFTLMVDQLWLSALSLACPLVAACGLCRCAVRICLRFGQSSLNKRVCCAPCFRRCWAGCARTRRSLVTLTQSWFVFMHSRRLLSCGFVPCHFLTSADISDESISASFFL